MRTNSISIHSPAVTPTALTSTIAGTFLSDLKALFDILVVWQKRDMERRHLAALSGAQLRDAGLVRSDLATEIKKPVWTA